MEKKFYASFVAALAFLISPELKAQCTLTDATSCVCETPGQTNCDLLPDLMISWYGLQNYASGPSEYPQSNNGRLRISGSTPNIGHGPLEVRTQSSGGQRMFICGTDTFTVAQGQTNFNCPNGQDPKQVIFQNVYKKQGNQMQRWERMAGSMTYHSAHSHYHVNDWTTMTLRLEEAGEPNPLNWPIVATGAKIGFCLMDYGSCTTYNGHCRTEPEYGQGSVLTTNQFTNQGLNGNYNCGTNVQGISVGRTDIYSESLDMMWINIMPNLCNGNYWIVAEVDPTNVFMEENDGNNWTAIPFTITQQRTNGSGGSAGIFAPNGLKGIQGSTVMLTATPGNSYLWSNGATTRSIQVSQAGNYSVQVTQPCGVLSSSPVNVTFTAPPAAPTGTGATVFGPASAQITASGSGQEILWYDSPSNGTLLHNGSMFTTPVLNDNTTYYASTRNTVAGVSGFGAKTNSSGSMAYSSVRQWLYFDAFSPFLLKSVKVYAQTNAYRHFVLTDNVGSVLQEKVVYIPSGTHRVDLDFQVPAGVNHRITAFDDNSEIEIALHRDATGVSYPYAIGTLGSITGSSAGAGHYYFLYDWEVRTPDVVLESARTPVPVTVTNGITLSARVFLEGPYNAQTGLMSDQLRVSGVIPSTEPFTAAGFTHYGTGGGEVLDPSLLSVTGNDAIVDWILLELRNASQPAQVIATKSALLKRSGHIISHNGQPVRFIVPQGSYNVAVRHRNHLGCMTAVPLAFGTATVQLDLTLPGTSTWGSSARKSVGPAMALWMGNTVNDPALRYTGGSNDRDPILVVIGGSIPTNTANGYYKEDCNLDGVVKYTGSMNDRDPILSNIGGLVPTQQRMQQLP